MLPTHSLKNERVEPFPYSLDEIDNILVGGDEPKLNELKELLMTRQGMSEKQFELSVEARKLRRRVHEGQDEELKIRLESNPAASEEELSLGAFIENIEPQARDAVALMRQKGYNTASSGFSDFNFQAVSFSEKYFSNLVPETRKKLEALGVTIEENRLSFACDRIDLQEIKEKWDAVAAALPDRGESASPSKLPAAESFRKKFGGAAR